MVGCQDVVGVDDQFIDLAFVGVVAQTGGRVVRPDCQVRRGGTGFGGGDIRRVKGGGVRSDRRSVNPGCKDSLELMIAVRGGITVVSLGFPRDDQVLPLTNNVIGVGQDVLPAGATA